MLSFMTIRHMPDKHFYAGLSLENDGAPWEPDRMQKKRQKTKPMGPLEHWRKARGLSQAQLGKMIGSDQTSISRFEAGERRPSAQQTVALAAALGIDARDLLPRRSGAPVSGAAAGSAAPAPRTALRRLSDTLADLAARPGFDVWQVRDRSMQMAGYLPGDFMLVHQLGDEAASLLHVGDAVIAQVMSASSGEAETVFRRFDPPFLMPASVDPDDKPVFGLDAHIRGKVIASWRLPELAA